MPSASGEPRLRFGKYRVLEHIAAGGMAAVYKAVDEQSGQTVALKVLAPDLAAREEARQRFRQEALMGTKLRHDHIVAILEYGETQGMCYLAMEFVPGTTVQAYLEKHGPLEPKQARAIALQIVGALDYAHQLGIIHRDVKPSNILLTRVDGKVIAKLGDLGLSRETREEDFRITREGHTVGTVDYMSPEQARDSRAADIRSDIYSLGCTLFQMLTGSPPFPQGTLIERMVQHAEREPPDLRAIRPEVPADLAAICRRMLAKRPEQRYQTPAELWIDLSRDRRVPPDQGTTDEVPTVPVHAGSGSEPRRVSEAAPPEAAPSEMPTLELRDDPSPTTQEQHRVAAGQFELAKKFLKAREARRGLQALTTAIRLHPTQVEFRDFLRELTSKGVRALRLPWHKQIYAELRYRVAKLTKNPWKILEFGEQVLIRRRDDVGTHLDLACAAQKVHCRKLAWWLLKQAQQVEDGPRVHREIALFLERQGDISSAIRFWELVERADPSDREAPYRIKALAARETIAKGNLKERVGEMEDQVDGIS